MAVRRDGRAKARADQREARKAGGRKDTESLPQMQAIMPKMSLVILSGSSPEPTLRSADRGKLELYDVTVVSLTEKHRPRQILVN